MSVAGGNVAQTYSADSMRPPVGDCAAFGEEYNLRGPIKTALRCGATPREVAEVMLQTSVNVGTPKALYGLDLFVQIMEEDGQLNEIGNPLTRSKMKG